MSINTEFQKIIQILSGSDFEGCFQPPATFNEILAVENITGISIDGGLRDLWLLANGAEYRRYGTPAFGVYTDEPTPCSFLSTQESIETWQNLFESSKNYEQDKIRDAQKWKEAFGQDLLASEIDYGPEETRDTRIKPVWSHPKWLPFATFNGYGTIVYYDADPNHGES